MLIKCYISCGLMVVDRLLHRTQINTLDALFGSDIDHELIPLLDLSRLVVDRVVDTGQKQTDDRRDNQLLIPADDWFKLLGSD